MSFHKKETEKIELVVRPGSQVVKGKVLMEFHRSTTFSASRDVHNLISLLEQNLGMSKSSMYNRSEFDQTKTWKQTRGVDFYAKRQFMRLPEAERERKMRRILQDPREPRISRATGYHHQFARVR